MKAFRFSVVLFVSFIVSCVSVLAGVFSFDQSPDSILVRDNSDITTIITSADFSTQLGLDSDDKIDAISLGNDPTPDVTPPSSGEVRVDIFAVESGAQGISGDLHTRYLAGKPVEQDLYRDANGSNLLYEDGYGDGELDAYDDGYFDPSVDTPWIYFSLAPGSPTIGTVISSYTITASDVLMVQYGSPATLAVFTQGINIGNSVDIDGLSIFDATKDGGAYIGSNDMIIYSDDTPADSTDKYIMHYGLGNPGSPEVHLHEDDFGIRDEDQITALAHTFVDTGVTDININRSYDRIGDDLDPEVYYCGEIEVYGIPGCLITFSAPEPSFLSNIALIEDPSVPGRYEYSDDSYVDEVEMTGDFPATGQYSLVIDGYELRFTFSATDIFPTEYPALSAPVVANNTDISVAPNVATNFVWNELADNGENIDNTIGTTASIDTDNSFIVSYGTKYPVNSHATYTGPNYLQPGDYCLTFDFVKTHLATDLTLAFINNRKSTKYNMNITGDLPVITNVQLFRSFDVNEDTPDGSYFFEGEINALSPDYVIKITPPSNAVPTGPYTLSLQSFDFHSSTYEYEYEEGKLDYATLTAAYPQGRYSIQVYESDGTTTVGSPIYADFGRYDESGTLQDLTMHNGQPSLLSPVPNAFQVSVLNSQPEFILNASTGSEEYDETALEIDNDDWGYQHQEIDNGPHIPEFTITEFNVSDTIPTGRLQLEISFSNVERRNIGEDLSIYCATERLTSYELVSARNNLDQAFGIDGITTTDFSFSSQGRAMLVLDNGDILVAGSLLDSSIYNCALAKYDSSGLLLSSFGNSAGKSIVSLTGSFMGEAIALQSDGKILVAGTYDNNSNLDFGIIRFNADGTQDMSFGETRTGFVATDVSSYADYAYAITVLDNDSFLVAGSGNEDFALIKYDSGGILDTSFGTSGIVVTDSGFFGNDIAYDIEILSNGSIILAGTMHNGSDYDFALIAYDSSGILVTSFGQSGKVMMDISGGSDDKLTAIDTIFENDIVVSGSTNVNGNYDFLLAKFSANGVLDVSFSEGETGRTGGRTGGLVITDFNSIDDKGLAMTVTDYNYIVVAGKTGETDKDFAIAVYEENGILDERFGNGGKIITKVTSNYDEINAVGLTGNDKLIVAGTSNYDFVVAQYDLGHRIIYVDNDSLRGGRPIFDGTSWASAYRDLQNALENAEAGSQIWIAAGTYYPVTPVDPANPTDEERKATFVLPGGVTLYGGFAGTETGLGERNSSVNQSILSGDLGTAEDNSDNSYHVVSVETSSELCELYITYGNAQNAEFTAGGGLLSFSSDLKIENCYFSENTGLRGGAIAIKSGEIDFDGCIFDSNTATHGPAIYVDMDTSVSFLNSVFAGNSSTNNGGAIVADGYVDIKNCSFGENAVTDGAGAAIWITSNGSANIDSSILWGNTDTVSNTQILNEGSLYAGYSCVMNLNPLGTNTSSDPQFLNAASVAGADGFPFTEDDGFSLDFSSPSINAANPGNTVDYDIADTQRPQGTGTDMGAYEYRNNMAPMLTGLEVSPIVYTEGNGEILLTELLTISDDSSTLASATVSISPYSFNDELLYNVRSGITSEYTGGVLTLTGPATINEFQT
ncbi:MAG: choice-of-anchor Q domain-containing protein, partial [Verrucomicrobiota bacterium]|nr:choice-of-anchor Q domain-containing protein [Verrucomicrobiota bacterium]